MTPAHAIVSRLRGRWYGSYGAVRCPAHEDKSPSLRIRDGESGVPLVSCYSGCDRLDIIGALKAQGVWPERDGSVQRDERPKVRRYASPAPNPAPRELTGDEAERVKFAAAIWRETIPPQGTAAERYWCEARGLSLAMPPVLRFGAAVPYGYDRGDGAADRLPAMVAKVQRVDGSFCGVHCTYLLPDGYDKARDRLVFGCVGGASIHLAEAAEEMCFGEGVETTAAYMQETRSAGWAAMNTSGLRSIVLPALPLAFMVALLMDADEPKTRPNGEIFYPGAEATGAAASRMRLEGRQTVIYEPAEGWKDFAQPFERRHRE